MNSIRQLLHSSKRSWLLLICIFLSLMGAFAMLLSKHLLEVQIDARLSKASKEQETLVFTYLPSEDKKRVLIYEDDTYHYYYYGIQEASIHYESTYTSFPNALKKEYITIEDMLDGCVKKESIKNTNFYVHASTKEKEDFQFAIETRKDEEGNTLGFYITFAPTKVDLIQYLSQGDALENMRLESLQKKC